MQRKRRFRKIGSNSTLSILRKELREGNLQSLLGGSQHLVSSSNTKPDPLLSSFMCNLPVVEPELKYNFVRQKYPSVRLPCQTRNKKIELEDVSLSKGCCYFPG
ncbi:hypothetical protein RHMOL_Rhmol02G0006100 [Rhododendron molle]|uniref:Uncharacterized protein n=1 Tax=Rhododendron molle TaxID=49168 RepID=A0ACC0PLW4_RHOML|nr:hypothetical protein RHMOL_Rhmol02G0006100 [Rhododendron molle]